MNTTKLALLVSTFIAGSAMIACSASSSEEVGSSEAHATADIDHMFKRPDGNYDVWCVDGTTQNGITVAQLKSDDVCGGPAAGNTSSSSSSGSVNNTSGGTNTAPNACIAADVPAPIQWNPPAAVQTVCTAADLDSLNTALSTAQTFDDLQAAVASNAACSSCIFTDVNAANWGPIITFGGGQGFVNWSACFARVDGGSDACGEAFFEQDQCVAGMCQACTDDASSQACQQTAVGNATGCGQYDLDTACNGFATVNSACPDLISAIAVVCGGK